MRIPVLSKRAATKVGRSPVMLDEESCWKAIQARDARADGRFLFGVLTTGVYCRPSCPARRPLRKNVRFYASPDDAERDGLRACLRCRPLAAADADAEIFGRLCQFMEEHSSENLTLDQLAARAGRSRFHFARRFQEVVGVSPKQYLEACRHAKLKSQLRAAGGVTEAIFEAGYGSLSRVYEKAGARLGMTPAEYRHGGRNAQISYAAVESPVGPMMLGATDRGVCFIRFGDSPGELLESLRQEYPAAELQAMTTPYPDQFAAWVKALCAHLAGRQPHLDLPLDVRATAFQMKVWRYLRRIPYGEVQSYGEVAAGLGAPRAARAVARACAANPVAIVIPCHRVIRGDGGIGGYRWGVGRKRLLIERECGPRAG
jgi:AraC family transcriptional regulator, regulatory protein of adaptative response / methylated-DNA-[protein]-cysteine methyltransferase